MNKHRFSWLSQEYIRGWQKDSGNSRLCLTKLNRLAVYSDTNRLTLLPNFLKTSGRSDSVYLVIVWFLNKLDGPFVFLKRILKALPVL